MYHLVRYRFIGISQVQSNDIQILTLAFWIASQIMFPCSKQPAIPGIPPFCTDVSIYWLVRKYFVSLDAKMRKISFLLYWERLDEIGLIGAKSTPSSQSAWVKLAVRDPPMVEIQSQVLESCLRTNNQNWGTINSAHGVSSDARVLVLLVATEMEQVALFRVQF